MANVRDRSLRRITPGKRMLAEREHNREDRGSIEESTFSGGACYQLGSQLSVCADLMKSLKRLQQSGNGKIVIVGALRQESPARSAVFGLPGKNPEFRWKDDALNGVYTIEFVGGAPTCKTIPGWSPREWMESGVQRILSEIIASPQNVLGNPGNPGDR